MDQAPASDSSSTLAALNRDTGTIRHDLRAIWGDGVTYSVMVGCGETYLAAFGLAVGLSDVAAGLLTSVPMVAGAMLQLISPRGVRQLGSHKRWVVTCAIVQACSFIPLIAAALYGRVTAPMLFLIAALYWGAGLATGPAWNTWVDTLIPRPVRATYFARRTRATHLVVLSSLLGAGLLLEFDRQIRSEVDGALLAFALIFLIASAARFTSVLFLASQTEPIPLPENHRLVGPIELLKRTSHSADGRLLRYMLFVQVAAYISAPFFTPFMLSTLKLSYGQYMILISASYASKSLMLPRLGGFVRAVGAQRLLWVCGMGIIPLAALWAVSSNFYYLLCVQLLSGSIWAGYELATFLLLFETIKREERTSVLTIFNAANAMAIFIGSLIGGRLLSEYGATAGAYLIVFLSSSAARLLTLLVLPRVVVEPTVIHIPQLRTTAVRPADTGSIERPILASMDDDDAELLSEPEPAQPRATAVSAN